MISSASAETGRPLVLITRPIEDTKNLAQSLTAAGFDTLLEPMLSIEPATDAEIDLSGCQAVLFTSANGVRAFAALCAKRDLPAVAVGPASAQAAREVGFTEVVTAGGDVEALATTVRSQFKPQEGTLFHASGSVTVGDLALLLEEDGYMVRRAAIYEAHVADQFSTDFRSAWNEGRIAFATFFSPRTAVTFVRLLQREQHESRAHTVSAACLSQAVAKKLDSVEWAGIGIAEKPETAALVQCVTRLHNEITNER